MTAEHSPPLPSPKSELIWRRDSGDIKPNFKPPLQHIWNISFFNGHCVEYYIVTGNFWIHSICLHKSCFLHLFKKFSGEFQKYLGNVFCLLKKLLTQAGIIRVSKSNAKSYLKVFNQALKWWLLPNWASILIIFKRLSCGTQLFILFLQAKPLR